MKIVVFGDIFLDILSKLCEEEPPKFLGRDSLASSIKLLPGGSALNTCVHMKALVSSLIMNLWSLIGDDQSGNLITNFLEKKGIITSDILKIDKRGTGSCVVISSPSDRGFITDRGAINELSWEYLKNILIPKNNAISNDNNFDVLHFSGYLNCTKLLEQDYKMLDDRNHSDVENDMTSCFRELYRLKQERSNIFDNTGCLVTMNPQSDATNNNWKKINSDWMNILDILITNEEEANEITKNYFNLSSGSSSPFNNNNNNNNERYRKRKRVDNINDICIHCRIATMIYENNNRTTWVVTKGSAGSCVYNIQLNDNKDDNKYQITMIQLTQKYIPKSIVDTTGAGDAFCAGFILKYAQTIGKSTDSSNNNSRKKVDENDLIDCLDYANASGARACTVLGGSSTDYGELIGDSASDTYKGIDKDGDVAHLECTCNYQLFDFI